MEKSRPHDLRKPEWWERKTSVFSLPLRVLPRERGGEKKGWRRGAGNGWAVGCGGKQVEKVREEASGCMQLTLKKIPTPGFEPGSCGSKLNYGGDMKNMCSPGIEPTWQATIITTRRAQLLACGWRKR